MKIKSLFSGKWAPLSVGIVVALIVAGYWMARKPEFDRPGARGANQGLLGWSPWKSAETKGTDARLGEGTSAEPMTVAELRSSLTDLERLAVELAEVKTLYEKKDRERFRSESKRIKERMKELEKRVRKEIAANPQSRDELYRMLESSGNLESKKVLAKLFNGLDEETRSKYFIKLAETSNPDNQEVAVRNLSHLKTPSALEGVTKVASNTSAESRVRTEAVRGIGRAAVIHYGNAEITESTRNTLRTFTKVENEPFVRKTAYESIAMNPYMTPDDKKFLDEAAKKETDPQARQAAEFAKRVAEATLRSREKRNAAKQQKTTL